MKAMRQTSAAVFLGAIASSTIVAAGGLPRGVGPEFVKFYEIKGSFACISHPSITISASQVNDNTCDCPDGSDEPGTAACSHLDVLSPSQPLAASLSGTTNTTNVLPGFWCANAGHVGAYVPFAFVNDGVCDYDLCCDGTEEFAGVGGVKCDNRCDSIGKEYRRIEAERRASKEKSAKRRQTLVKEAKELRRQVEAKIDSLNGEIRSLTVRKEELQKKYEDAEKAESGKVVKSAGTGKLGVLLGLSKTRVKELRDTLDKVLDQRDDLQERVEELEEILKHFKDEYNPNFNDEGVKAAVHSWEDYAAKKAEEKASELVDGDILDVLKEDGAESGINWEEFETGEASDTDVIYNLEAYLPGALREYVHEKLNLLRIWLIENGLLADNPKSSGESRLVTAAREAFQSASDELSSKETALGEQLSDLEQDYGADDIFRAIKGKCVSRDSGEYEYELCWMGQTTQKSKSGHGTTNMGNFVRLDTEIADEEERADGKGLGRGPRLVLRYDNGQGCWNGPNRRTDVWLACSEKDELWRVSESEKCVYKMEIGTPAACEDVGEPGLQTKDEL